ncbi:MAG TPA: hypothetical protein DEB39_14690 [Planctomycetaceae bacterium]|nr:hypothetical protein [Planctomycetaceae bacterium]
MLEPSFTPTTEVDELLRNVELRNELEPYYDESISRVDIRQFPLQFENEYLASMLAWETAPVLPIYRWFEPELRLPKSESLDDEQLSRILEDLIEKLFEKQIVLDFTDHLSNRELYTLIYRDILPIREKNMEHRSAFLHWDCSYSDGDPDTWLRYYASDEDRECWAETYRQQLPPRSLPPFQRNLPQHPF